MEYLLVSLPGELSEVYPAHHTFKVWLNVAPELTCLMASNWRERRGDGTEQEFHDKFTQALQL